MNLTPDLLLPILYHAFGRVEGGLASPGPNCRRDIPSVKGTYPFIPFDIKDFVSLLTVAPHHVKTGRGKSAPRRFLDVGAGYGTKVILAKSILDYLDHTRNAGYWTCHGIEIEPRYVKACLIPDVTLADGLTFKHYALYDIIYMYCPFMDHELQIKLQQAAIDGARPGAIILFAGCCKDMRRDTLAGHQGYQSVAPDRYTDQMERVSIPDAGQSHLGRNLDHFIWRKRGYANQAGAHPR